MLSAVCLSAYKHISEYSLNFNKQLKLIYVQRIKKNILEKHVKKTILFQNAHKSRKIIFL